MAILPVLTLAARRNGDSFYRLSPLAEVNLAALQGEKGGETIRDIRLDIDGSILVLFNGITGLSRILVTGDSNPEYRENSMAGGMINPASFSLSGIEIRVADPGAGSLFYFSRQLELIMKRELFYPPGERFLPFLVASSPHGDLFVVDENSQYILRLDFQGRVIEEIGGYGFQGISIDRPIDLEISGNGDIAILDAGIRSIFLFDRYGTSCGVIPWPEFPSEATGLSWMDNRLWICGDEGVTVIEKNGKTFQLWKSDIFGGEVLKMDIHNQKMVAAAGSRILIYSIQSQGNRPLLKTDPE